MPFYEGETLRQRLDRGTLPPGAACSIARQTATGLARAHGRGIIHRDVKPANLMLTADGVVKILDFGIAKLSRVEITQADARPGTIAYMSPEQAAGLEIDGRADVWSLGIVLHEMLTGTRPVAGVLDATRLREAFARVPRMSPAAASEQSTAAEQLLGRALAQDVDERHETIAEFGNELDALVRLLTQDPASARRSTAPRRLPRAAVIESEWRHAAVAVCRIAGYADCVQSMAAERADAEVRRVHQAAQRVAREYDATVERTSNELLTLVFGLPVAHEDDAIRAVRAVLALHDRVEGMSTDAAADAPRLRLQSGIDAGAVMAQPSSYTAAPFSISGDTVLSADRLSGLASPGDILISADCARLTGDFLRVEACPPIALAGRAQPLVAWRVLGDSGLRSRLEVAGQAKGLTPLAGRETELLLLARDLDAACAGRGRFVTILGEAGVGKSRMVHEFRASLATRDVLVLHGRCQSYGGAAYLPFVELLRDALRLDDVAPGERAEAAILRIRELDGALEDFIPLLLHLLSLANEAWPLPQHLRGEQFVYAAEEAVAALLTALTRRRPTVLLLEDWHWVDDASAEVLRQLIELVADHALLIVVTMRPDAAEPWPTSIQHEQLLLRPLEPGAAHTMLCALLHVSEVPADLARLLHERTGGNPFFLEEICQTLVEQGALRVERGVVEFERNADELVLPATVQAVIRVRLDRLDPAARDVLRYASVVGREFPRRVLEHARATTGHLPEVLDVLKSAGLIQQTRVLPDAVYRFKHVLTQEVTYGGMLEHRRRELHGRVGEAIEQVYQDRLDEHFERLAHHFSNSGDARKAVHYIMRAADRAGGLARFDEALTMLERARVWLARLPAEEDRDQTLIAILLRQERLCETLGQRERQQRIIDEMLALVEQSGDQPTLAEVCVRQGDLYTLLRRFDDAEAALLRSLEIRRATGDAQGQRNTLRSLGLLRVHQHRDAEALALVEEALAIDRVRGDDLAIVGDLSNLGYILKGIGALERARTQLLAGLELARRIVEPLGVDSGVRGDVALMESYLLHNLANVYGELGDEQTRRDYLERARVLTAGKRLPIQLSYHYTSLAHIHLRAGSIDEALEYYRAAVDLTRRARFVPGLVQSLRMLGEVLVGLGRRTEALASLQEAAELFAQLEDAAGEAQMRSHIATTLERDGDTQGAGTAWRAAAALYARCGDGVAEARARNKLGIIAWSRRDHDAAMAEYERALALFREQRDDAGEGLMLNSLAATLRAMSRAEDARQLLEQALAHHRRAGLAQLEGHALALLGEITLDNGDAAGALRHFQASLEIRRRTADQRGEAWMLYFLARTQARLADTHEADRLAQQARALAGACADAELLAACDAL